MSKLAPLDTVDTVMQGDGASGRPVQMAREGVTGAMPQPDNALKQGDALAQDEALRLKALLNSLLPVGVLIAVGILVIVRIGWLRGYFGPSGIESNRHVLLTVMFPLAVLPLTAVAYLLARSGRAEAAARVYVWVLFTVILIGAAVFNGYESATWLLLLWPVALAGTLFRPVIAMLIALGALACYGGVALAQSFGWYAPLLPTDPEGFPFFALSFGWLMLVGAVALVNHLSGVSLYKALSRLREVTRDLESTREGLAQEVNQRTADLAARASQLRTIAEVTQTAAATQDLEQLLSGVVRLVAERLDFYHVGIFLLDEAREWAVLRAASSEGGRQMLARHHRLRVGQQGIVGYVAEMAVTRFAVDVGEDAVWFRNPDLPETRSEIALPLIVAEQLLGVLDIQTREPAAFGEQDVETLRVLADGIAIAINNARLLGETRETLARLERYRQTDVVQGWRQALARRGMRVGYRYSASGVQPLTAPDTMEELPASGTEAGVPQLSVSEGDLPAELQWPEGIVRQATADGRYLLQAPVTVAGQRLGMLSFEREVPWGEETVQLVEAVIGQLDLALNNARLLEETRLRAMQEAARSEIVGRVRALTSTDAILRSAAEELGRALQVERARIQLVRPGK